MAVIRCPDIDTVNVRVPYCSLDDALYVPSRGPVGVCLGVGAAVGFEVDFVDAAGVCAVGSADAWTRGGGVTAVAEPRVDSPGSALPFSPGGPATTVAVAAPDGANGALPFTNLSRAS